VKLGTLEQYSIDGLGDHFNIKGYQKLCVICAVTAIFPIAGTIFRFLQLALSIHLSHALCLLYC